MAALRTRAAMLFTARDFRRVNFREGGACLRSTSGSPATSRQRSILTQALRKLADGIARRAGGSVDISLTENVTAAGKPRRRAAGDDRGRRTRHLLLLVELSGGARAVTWRCSTGLSHSPTGYSLCGARRRDGPRAIRDEIAGATGFRVLGFWDNGFRHISNARRPIRTPADCAGLRIRTVNNAHAPGVFPQARLRAGVHRHQGHGPGDRGRHRRCPGKSADQHRQFRAAALSPLCLADIAHVRRGAAAGQSRAVRRLAARGSGRG